MSSGAVPDRPEAFTLFDLPNDPDPLLIPPPPLPLANTTLSSISARSLLKAALPDLIHLQARIDSRFSRVTYSDSSSSVYAADGESRAREAEVGEVVGYGGGNVVVDCGEPGLLELLAKKDWIDEMHLDLEGAGRLI